MAVGVIPARRRIALRGGRLGGLGDRLFRGLTVAFAAGILVLLGLIVLVLFNDARAALDVVTQVYARSGL